MSLRSLFVRFSARRGAALAGTVALALALSACQQDNRSTRHIQPIPPQTLALMQSKGMSQGDPILIRAYKKEAEMEIWKRTGVNGQYALLKTYPICRWSGQLGPKTRQGDRQAPEGFYTVSPGQMNPNSAYWLSFDTGYPNAYDRSLGRTGNAIMVHGNCSSSGCFAMTDASMAELYAVAREAFAGGQHAFQFQSYPFRMNAANLAKFRADQNAPFWMNLKEGSDYFETLREEPRVGVCENRYVFGGSDVAAGSCAPQVHPAVAQKRARDAHHIADLVAKGIPAARVVYADGGQNPVFRRQSAYASLPDAGNPELGYSARDYAEHDLGHVSRADSLAIGPQEIEINAPGPTKAAAAALAARNTAGASATMLAAHTAPGPKPGAARIKVADAEGDPAAFAKALKAQAGPSPRPAAAATPSAAPLRTGAVKPAAKP